METPEVGGEASGALMPPSCMHEAPLKGLRARAVIIVSSAVVAATVFVTLAPLAILRVDTSLIGSNGRSLELLKHVADTRTALLQLIGGLAAAGTVYFIWRNFLRSTADSARLQEEALVARRQATEARFADSYIKAGELLGRESQAVRASAALAFGRLLRSVSQSTDLSDYWAIMDALTTFVRHRTALWKEDPKRSTPDQDVEAALNVLARRTYISVPRRADDSPTDLSGCDLTGAWMTGGKFPRSYFGGTRFCKAYFDNADVSESDFQRTDLTGAYFRSVHVQDADFSKTNIEEANFDGTDLLSAKLNEKQRVWWIERQAEQSRRLTAS